MTQPKLKLDDTVMLDLLLDEIKETKGHLIRRLTKMYGLEHAKLVTTQRIELKRNLPNTETKMYMDESIYRGTNCLIRATKYGRVKDIRQIAHEPQVIIKKKRTINR
jgi:hypothetical protein